jgi:glycosyltransferase involved in cell wall biosynthesis
LDLALKAMAEPCVRDKNIRLIIAGEYYDKKEKYDALIAELGIADRILQFDHYIPAEEVKYYFAVADCVLQPYKTATQSGITQVAYNFDTPMIVTNVGGLPEIVENGKVGFVVEVNEKAIAEGICTFYDQQLNESFSDNVSKAKEKFSWHYFVQQLITKFS